MVLESRIELSKNNKIGIYCNKCRTELISKNCELTIENEKIKPKHIISKLSHCPSCYIYYITQDECLTLIKNIPGFHYDFKQYKIQKILSTKTVLTIHTNNNDINISLAKADPNEVNCFDFSSQRIKSCSTCLRPLQKIICDYPVYKVNNKLFSYYNAEIFFCPYCRSKHIERHTIIDILEEHLKINKYKIVIKFKNTTIYPDKYENIYYFDYGNYKDYFFIHKSEAYFDIDSVDDNFTLRNQSFLKKMGYSTQIDDNTRRYILNDALIRYGESEVKKLLLFFISSRERQINGAIRYSHALRIWKEDLKYICAKKKN